jgi:glycosyltransferase involved in cell wall biosynthesis
VKAGIYDIHNGFQRAQECQSVERTTMRFLVLTQYFPPEVGAAQVRLAAVVRELVKLGHQVEIVTALPNYPDGQIFTEYRGRFYQQELWEGLIVHRVWVYAAKGAGLKRLLNYTSFMLTAGWGLGHAQRPDYIFVESPPLFLGITAYLIAKKWRVPFILNVADLWLDAVQALEIIKEGFALRWAKKLEKWLYRQAYQITVVTEGLREILHTEKQVPIKKIGFLPNGVDTQLFCSQPPCLELNAQFSLPTYQYLIVYAGTHGYMHNLDILLDTAQQLAEQAVLFLLVGGGSEKPRLVERCQQLRAQNVCFLPPQPPKMIAQLYNLSLAGVSTLRDSPLAQSIRPAKVFPIMACAKPVLYSGDGEGAKLVTQAQAGLVVPPNNATALVEAIQQLIDNPQMTRQLGQNGRIYVQTHWQWSTLVANWLQQLKGN